MAKNAIKNLEIWETFLFDLWKSVLALLWPWSQREDTDEKYKCYVLWIRFLSRVRKGISLSSGCLAFLLKHTIWHNWDLEQSSRGRYWVTYVLPETKWQNMYFCCYLLIAHSLSLIPIMGFKISFCCPCLTLKKLKCRVTEVVFIDHPAG